MFRRVLHIGARAIRQHSGQILISTTKDQFIRLATTGRSTSAVKAVTGVATVLVAAAAPVFLIDGSREGYVAHVRKLEPELRQAIADVMDGDDFDTHGSYGPIFVRLAWHSSGTYDKTTNTGGSNGASMRFEPESTYGANKGLNLARDRLEIVKKKFPTVSYADLWTLAGCVAIEEMGGPKIPWRPGRSDYDPKSFVCPPDARLPDASQGSKHIRDIFYRMGFNDQEITALIGAHALGKTHPAASGYEGPWTRSPTTFSNTFYTALLDEKWQPRSWKGPMQYENEKKDLMMLPSDMAFLEDPAFKKYVLLYAKDEQKFFEDFAKAYAKLLELGVPFPKEEASPSVSTSTTAPSSPSTQQGIVGWFKGLVGKN